MIKILKFICSHLILRLYRRTKINLCVESMRRNDYNSIILSFVPRIVCLRSHLQIGIADTMKALPQNSAEDFVETFLEKSCSSSSSSLVNALDFPDIFNSTLTFRRWRRSSSCPQQYLYRGGEKNARANSCACVERAGVATRVTTCPTKRHYHRRRWRRESRHLSGICRKHRGPSTVKNLGPAHNRAFIRPGLQ